MALPKASIMSIKISKLTIPNDLVYLEGIICYCSALSRKIGFSSMEVKGMCVALKEICANVITQTCDPNEDESLKITFEVLEDGIKITLDETGLPLLPKLEDRCENTPGMRAIGEYMDNILCINKGKGGIELQLIKYLKGRHVEEFFSDHELKPYDFCELPSRDEGHTIRLMQPEEAVDVSRCIYKTYRHTYLNEDLYFPEKISAMNRDGRMISSVAVSDANEVIAHFALLPRPNGQVAEIGVAVVDPRYRRRGLMQKLLDHLIVEANECGFVALYGNAFTMHPNSQKTNLKFGFKETAIQLGGFPPESIKPLQEKELKGAGHVITFYRFLKEAEGYKVYMPPQHNDMLEAIYEHIGIRRPQGDRGEPWAKPMPDESVIYLVIKPFHKTAIIEVKGYGQDIERRVEAKLVELANKGFNAIYLDLHLRDPHTAIVCGKLEEIGFFFSGLLPDYSEGDVLRLQCYNTRVDYDEIEAVSPFTLKLMDYIKGLDTKWRALH
jgi:serine/threonine-protein kinase RsbW